MITKQQMKEWFVKDMESNNKIIKIGFIPKTENGGDGKPHESNLVYSVNGVAPCCAASFGYKQPAPMIIIKENKDDD